MVSWPRGTTGAENSLNGLARRAACILTLLVALAGLPVQGQEAKAPPATNPPGPAAQSSPESASPPSSPANSEDKSIESSSSDAGAPESNQGADESKADDNSDDAATDDDKPIEGDSTESDDPADESDDNLGDDLRSAILDPSALPPYEVPGVGTLPGEFASEIRAKPGHWTTFRAETRVNQFDFRGELEATLYGVTGESPVVEMTPFRIRYSRPVVLAKGASRFLEFEAYAPIHVRTSQAAVRLLQARDDDALLETRQSIMQMPAHQQYIVVLTEDPSEYQYLRGLDVVRAPSEWFGLDEEQSRLAAHYRVAIPSYKNSVPLPSSALCWTSTAYVVWDGTNPRWLNPDQQTALVDWLHWGGQLIVAGPNTLPIAAGSFLEPLLPATANGAWQFGKETDAALSQLTARESRKLFTTDPWAGVKLAASSDARVLIAAGNEPLVVERSVGRGRIVLTAFSLGEINLVGWPLYDALWNQYLLKRPARRFTPGYEPAIDWADEKLNWFAPELISRLRYFSRDATLSHKRLVQLGFDDDALEALDRRQSMPLVDEQDEEFSSPQSGRQVAGQFMKGSPGGMAPGGVFPPSFSDRNDVDAPRFGPGVAGWDDFNAVARLARGSLQTAAGIKVPKVGFVALVIVIYAVVLAPLNYVVFRLLRRVEWAWFAAPVIAVGCTFAVTYLAQLDIGFARSHTEIAVVEAQPGYSRAHATRFVALYGSLGADYEVQLADRVGLALPFARGNATDTGADRSTVDFRRVRTNAEESEEEGEGATESQASLERVGFPSNSTGMIRAEHFVELGGQLRWEELESGRLKITNDTTLTLHNVRILWRPVPHWDIRKSIASAAELERVTDWLGAALPDLEPGQSTEAEPYIVADDWIVNASTFEPQRVDDQTAADLSALARMAMWQTPAGELRLIAEVAGELPGMTVRPVSTQIRRSTLLIAHLDHAPEWPTETDANARADAEEYITEPEGASDPHSIQNSPLPNAPSSSSAIPPTPPAIAP